MTLKRPSNPPRTGFTIVEMVLSTAFLSILLITIAILTISVLTSYQKGLVFKSVNSVGQSIIDDMRRAINTSKADSNVASNTYFKAWEATSDSVVSQIGGRFCIDSHTTYVWTNVNTATKKLYNLADNGNTKIYAGSSDPNPYQAKLARVSSTGDINYCKPDDSGAYPKIITSSAVTYTELISSSESERARLALYNLYVYAPVSSDHAVNSNLFNITFILGTQEGTKVSTNTYCAPPDGYTGQNADFTYCAVNRFSLTMRTTGNMKED